MIIGSNFILLLLLVNIASDILTICGTIGTKDSKSFVRTLLDEKKNDRYKGVFIINSPFRETKLLIDGKVDISRDGGDTNYRNLLYEKEVTFFFESHRNHGEIENIKLSVSPVGCRALIRGIYKIKIGKKTSEMNFKKFIFQTDYTARTSKLSGSLIYEKELKTFDIQINFPEQRYLFFEGSRCHAKSQGKINGVTVKIENGVYIIGEAAHYCDELISLFEDL